MQQELGGDLMAMHGRLEELATRWEAKTTRRRNDCYIYIDSFTEELREILKGVG